MLMWRPCWTCLLSIKIQRSIFNSIFRFYLTTEPESVLKYVFFGGGRCSVLIIHYIEFCLRTQAIIISSVFGMLCSLVDGIRGFVL